MSALDKSEALSEISTEKDVEIGSATETETETETSTPESAILKKKKGMPEFLKYTLWGVGSAFVLVLGAGGYLVMQGSQTGASNTGWQTDNSLADDENEGAPPEYQGDAVLAVPESEFSSFSSRLRTADLPHYVPPPASIDSFPTESMHVESSMDVESVMAILTSLQDQQVKLQATVDNFDKAAMVLHNQHSSSLLDLKRAQQEQSQALLAFKADLQQLKPEDITSLTENVKKYKAQLDAIEKSADKNSKNIKWISYTRLCAAEQKLGLNRYADYCDFDKKAAAQPAVNIQPKVSQRPVARQQPVQRTVNQAPVQRLSQVNIGSSVVDMTPQAQIPQPQFAQATSYAIPATAEVPVTIAAPMNNMVAMTYPSSTQGTSRRDHNPCFNADRNWAFSLIADSQALIYRPSDGYETLIDAHTNLQGLGRVQMFNTQSYPQYIQFSNGVVCGG